VNDAEFDKRLRDAWKLIWNNLQLEKLRADFLEMEGLVRSVPGEFNEGMRAGVKLAEQIYDWAKKKQLEAK
jgi:hypothetical protein